MATLSFVGRQLKEAAHRSSHLEVAQNRIEVISCELNVSLVIAISIHLQCISVRQRLNSIAMLQSFQRNSTNHKGARLLDIPSPLVELFESARSKIHTNARTCGTCRCEQCFELHFSSDPVSKKSTPFREDGAGSCFWFDLSSTGQSLSLAPESLRTHKTLEFVSFLVSDVLQRCSSPHIWLYIGPFLFPAKWICQNNSLLLWHFWSVNTQRTTHQRQTVHNDFVRRIRLFLPDYFLTCSPRFFETHKLCWLDLYVSAFLHPADILQSQSQETKFVPSVRCFHRYCCITDSSYQ